MVRDFQPALHRALGEIALAEQRPKDALAEFARGDTAADGYPVVCITCLALNSGRAYDQAGNVESALAMYERFETATAPGRLFGGVVTYAPYRAAIYKRLGELYESRGDRARAAANYRQFIALWKDAEPELQPVVADARHHLANLGSEPTHEVRSGQPIR